MQTNLMRVVLIAIAILAATGCSAMKLTAPDGYATVKSSQFVQKLMSPSGSVIGLRRFDNPDKEVSVGYWAAALEYQKTTQEKMTLTAREELSTTRGLPGYLFTFEVGEGTQKISYLIGLFVSGDSIYAIEVGGKPESIAADRERIIAAIRSLG